MAETIAEIQKLVKDVSRHQELSDSESLTAINDFYQNQFHVDIGKSSINTMWNFQTLPNTDEYAVPEMYRLINSDVAFLNGEEIDIYVNDLIFKNDYKDAYIVDESIGTGDAVTATFTGTLSSFPVVPEAMIAYDGVETFKDAGSGVLTGSLGGTGSIVYATGVYSVTFNTAPADGQDIATTYAEYTAAQPSAILFYDNTIKLRPIPDSSYDIEIQVVKRPITLTASSVLPSLLWADAIAYGTAVNILNSDGNFEGAAIVESVYKKKLGSILSFQYKIKTTIRKMIPRW